MADQVYFLIDCNNFYVSCERLFRPELWKRPVIVLSNNDGCFISRSDEVKKLGIPMGAPYFKWKDEVEKLNAVIFSANFSLYGDISNRVMQVLETFSNRMEIYSIDEAFLVFDYEPGFDYATLGREIRDTVKKWVGIPVSIGIGPTKTLAKLGNKLARKHADATGGAYSFIDMDSRKIDEVLETQSVDIIWGIGRQSTKKLEERGVTNVRKLRDAPDYWLRKLMGVVGVRVAWELRGIPCIALEDVRPIKKGIISSRSFGRPVTTFRELRESIATYTSRAAEKLREDKCLAGHIQVYITTNRFDPETHYSNSYGIPLPQPTSYTPELSRYAIHALRKIYRPRQEYKKALVMLTGIVPTTNLQMNLFLEPEKEKKQTRVMQAFDAINKRFGRHVIRYAAEGTTQLWGMKSEQRSPSYTTDWKSLPVVRVSK